MALVFGCLAMLYSLTLYRLLYQQRFHHLDIWLAPGDIWNVIDGGRFVWHGALGYVYRGSGSYALPLSFILSAPVSAVIDHFNLVEGLVPLARPSAWLVAGPFSLIFGVFLLDSVRRLAWDLGVRRRLALIQALAVGLVLVPGFEWGHFEDVLALTFVVHATRYLVAEDYVRAGFLVSLAVSSKQWAVMLIPLLVFAAPRGRRMRTLGAACALPAVFVLLFFGVDFRYASKALLSPVNLGKTAPGHISFYATWLGSKTSQVSRTLGTVASLFVAWPLRKVQGAPRILAVTSVLLLIRPFSEAINYSYYWAPALIFAGLVGVAAHHRLRLRDWMWQIPAIAWTLPHGDYRTASWWWLVLVVMLICTWTQVAWNCGFSFRNTCERIAWSVSKKDAVEVSK